MFRKILKGQAAPSYGAVRRVAVRLAAPRRRETGRRGRDSNPRTSCPVSGFQDRCIRPLCHPSGAQTLRLGGRPLPRLYTGPRAGRGGRVAEGTRLLSEYGVTSSIAGSNPALSASPVIAGPESVAR